MLEDDIRRVRAREVPWNELRQAGTLRRIEKARAAPRRPARGAPAMVLLGACAVVACLVIWRVRVHGVAAPATATAMSVPAVTAQRTSEMILRLADGFIARQAAGASG